MKKNVEKKSPDPRFETNAIHQGLDYREQTGAVIPPVFLTSTFEHGNPGGFDYTRSGNPNFRNLQAALAAVESAKFCTVFGSGVGAITAIVSTLKNGDRVLCEENIYGCTYRLFDKVFGKFGVTARYIDFTAPGYVRVIHEYKPALVWIESPTNPSLKVLDIARIAAACKRAGRPLVVDNTFASSYNQRPLELGADLSLISSTKYTNGHSDALGGAVCSNSANWQQQMLFAQKALGLQPSPFDCWLIQRGLKTEAVRMARHNANALALAKFLEKSGRAHWVRHPFLPSHPQYRLAKKQMAGGSGIVSADFGMSVRQALKFCKSLKLFTLAESLGGIESLVCHPTSMTHASIPKKIRAAAGISDSLIRFSVGIEHIDDLLADVERALKK